MSLQTQNAPSSLPEVLVVRHNAVVTRQHVVLILARQIGALEPQRIRQYALDVVRHFMARFPAVAGELRRQLVEERHFVFWTRVHEEEEWVHALPPACRRAVEHGDLDVHRHGHDLVCELREQRAETQQKGLSACGALRAHN